MATTLAIRTCLLPFALKTIRNNLILGNLRPETEKYSLAMQRRQKEGDMLGAQQEAQKLRVGASPLAWCAPHWPTALYQSAGFLGIARGVVRQDVPGPIGADARGLVLLHGHPQDGRGPHSVNDDGMPFCQNPPPF